MFYIIIMHNFIVCTFTAINLFFFFYFSIVFTVILFDAFFSLVYQYLTSFVGGRSFSSFQC